MATGQVDTEKSLREKLDLISEMSVPDLKKECEKFGVLKMGKKEDLVERIKVAIEEKITTLGMEGGVSTESTEVDVSRSNQIISHLQAIIAEKELLIEEKSKRIENLEEINLLQKARIMDWEYKSTMHKCIGLIKPDTPLPQPAGYQSAAQSTVGMMVARLETPIRAVRQGQPLGLNVGHQVDTNDLSTGNNKEVTERTTGTENTKINRIDLYRRLIGGVKEATPSGSDDNEKKKKINSQVLVFGDAMIRGAGKLCEEKGCKVYVFPGIRAKELEKKITERKEETSNAKVIVVNVGTNNIKARTGTHLMVEIGELIDKTKAVYNEKTKIVIGGIVYRDDVYYTTIDKLNDSIKWICEEKGASFYDPNSRISANEAAKDGIHLNYAGGRILGNIIMEKVEGMLGTEE